MKWSIQKWSHIMITMIKVKSFFAKKTQEETVTELNIQTRVTEMAKYHRKTKQQCK